MTIQLEFLYAKLLRAMTDSRMGMRQGKTAAEAVSHAAWEAYAFQILTAQKECARMDCAPSLDPALTAYLMGQKLMLTAAEAALTGAMTDSHA